MLGSTARSRTSSLATTELCRELSLVPVAASGVAQLAVLRTPRTPVLRVTVSSEHPICAGNAKRQELTTINMSTNDLVTDNKHPLPCPLANAQLLDDDPCWGSPDCCSLSHLVSLLDQTTSILLETQDYIVLNKPPDLRMDGPYPSTVQKLLRYWYPPPPSSLEVSSSSLVTSQPRNNHHPHDHDMRRKKDDTAKRDQLLRPCHQLDYATSGVLWVARTQSAAAAACLEFAQRRTRKVYLAVLHGHLHIQDHWDVLKKTTTNDNDTTTNGAWWETSFQDTEQDYRQARAKKRKDTFVGFLPVHAVFTQWKQHIQNQTRKQNHHQQQQQQQQQKDSNKRPRKNETLQEMKHALWTEFALENVITDPDKVATMKYSKVKQRSDWKQAFENLADRYNNALRTIQCQSTPPLSQRDTLSTFFRVEGEQGSFYISAPLAQVPDQFAMHTNVFSNKDDDNGLHCEYKPSLTKCTILSHAYCQGHAITKVRLEPVTGRRHQLRVHMATVAGHAIVGDVTYEAPHNPNDLCRRMCLHAYQLSIFDWTVTAPDPFEIQNDGRELVVHGL